MLINCLHRPTVVHTSPTGVYRHFIFTYFRVIQVKLSCRLADSRARIGKCWQLWTAPYSSFFSSHFFLLFICFRHLSLSLAWRAVSSYSQSSSAFNSLCYIYFLTVDPSPVHLCCIFLFFSFPHRALFKFLFEAGCCEWPNTIWMHQLWVNC